MNQRHPRQHAFFIENSGTGQVAVDRPDVKTILTRRGKPVKWAKTWRLLMLLTLSVVFGFLTSGAGQAQETLKTQILEAKTGSMKKIGPALFEIYQQYGNNRKTATQLKTTGNFEAANPVLKTENGRVVIDAVASGETEALLEDLSELGFEDSAAFGRMVSGTLPIEALAGLAQLKTLQFARPAMAATQVGLVTSEGDPAMNADLAREESEVSGRGVTVGAMSDSYDCLGGAADDIATGDLPRESRITILDDSACPGSDEGRAMMQLIRDVAPRSDQAFHTAFGGQADFAWGIIELAIQAGSDIIVDDVFYYAEPMFQDGIIAQAVDLAKTSGVAYFSSAGNGGRNAWETEEGGFVSSGIPGIFGGMRHDFDPGPGVDDLQSVLIGTGLTIFVFQWDEPFFSVSGAPGSASDMDIILYLPGGTFIGIGGYSFNIGGDAVEVFGVRNSGPPAILEIGLELWEGPAPNFMKYVVFDPRTDSIDDPPSSYVIDFPTDSGTNYGHSNAAGAAGVGAAFWRRTPRFGVFPPMVEAFSSAGGTPILFDTTGSRISPEIRLKPDFVAPDGGITTFFGTRDTYGNVDPDGTNFFGTSAAAPHAAAVAALMLEANRRLTPDDIFDILKDSAIDMDDPVTPYFDFGFDFGTGFGLIEAMEAVEEAEEFEDDD
ncbi:MAG: S8 family serine peptidase [Desulfobacteraceae bacterium]|nr:S8 family serine peptidase [Desulfobacteraceae bacterium]